MSPSKRHRRPPVLRPLAWLCLPCALALLAPPAARADGDPDSVPATRAAAAAAARTARGAAAAASGPAPAAPSAAASAPVAGETGLAARMTLDLRQASVATALRLISEVSGHNVVATRAASEHELTLYLVSTTAGEALDAVTRAAGLWVLWRPQSRSYLVMTAEEYQRELTVFGEERTEVLRLRHHNVVAAANSLRALFGSRVLLQTPVEESLGETLKVTDLRRATSSGGAQSFNPAGTRNAAGGGSALAPGLSLADAQAAGMTRDQRGGSRTAAAGAEGVQIAAAAAAAGAATGQTEAAQRGQEAPIHVTYNRLHNLLIVRTGDPRALQAITELVGRIDLPARQVLLEMRIIQVRLDDEFHRAFDFDFFGTSAAAGVATTATGQPLNPLTGSTVTIDPVTGAVTAPRVVGALGNFNLFDRNSGIFQLLNNRIRLRLQLLEEQGRVETLAKPLLLASNNEPARLFIGEEVVLTTGASAQTTTGTTGASNTVITAETERRNVGTTLVIHPRINDDRTVTLTIDQENSERVAGGTTIPLATGTIGDGVVQYPIDTVNSAAVQAVAMAKDGLTIAVGGLIKVSKADSDTAVPGLSAIPLLGELFKSKKRVAQRSELVLVITPYVLETAEEADAVSRQLQEREREARAPAPAPAASAPPQEAAPPP